MAPMIINYDDFYRLRVDVVKTLDVYQLTLERVDMPHTSGGAAFVQSTQKYLFNKTQLKELVDYLDNATHDHI